MLLARDDVLVRSVAIRNLATNADRFETDALQLMRVERAARCGGLALAGYYHSHVAGPLAPSPIDLAATPWPGVGPRLHLIVSPLGEYRLFQVTPQDWIEVRVCPTG
jgi:proteasome lid subunit RPN8/RPN11